MIALRRNPHFALPARLLTLALAGTLSLGLAAFRASTAVAATCAQSYTVQAGDNLYRIGLKFGVAWTVLAEANSLANPHLIFPGAVLCIPAPGTVATAAPTSQPKPTGQPTIQPTLAPGAIPSISILSSAPGLTVTIRADNFPAQQSFAVLMGKNGTLGIDGIQVTNQDSGTGGSFTATYTIPASLKNERVIAIRLQSASGYYSYGWFSNQAAP